MAIVEKKFITQLAPSAVPLASADELAVDPSVGSTTLKYSGQQIADGVKALTALNPEQLVLGGASGEISQNSNLTFDGNTLGVGSGATASSAALDITSSDQGIKHPVISPLSNISSPVEGLTVYYPDMDGLYVHNGSEWTPAVRHAYGDYFMVTPTLTTIPAVNTPVKISGTTGSDVNLLRFFTAMTNRLTYTGSEPGIFQLEASLSADAVATQVNCAFYFAVNGSIVPQSAQRRRLANLPDIASISLTKLLALSPNDFVEVWVANETDATNITVTELNVTIVGID